MSRSLRSVRLALHPARCFLQRFPNGQSGFKLFGSMGLMLVFIIGQSFYLTRHVKESE